MQTPSKFSPTTCNTENYWQRFPKTRPFRQQKRRILTVTWLKTWSRKPRTWYVLVLKTDMVSILTRKGRIKHSPPRKLLDYLIIIQTLHVTTTFFFQTCLVNFFWWIIFVSMQKHWPRNKSMCCPINLKRCSIPIGDFRVPPGLCIKTRLSAQPLIQN